MKLNICDDCKKETKPLFTYARGQGNASHHHYCEECKKIHTITLFDTFKDDEHTPEVEEK